VQDREDLHAIKDVCARRLSLIRLRIKHLDLEDLGGIRRGGRASLPPNDGEDPKGGDGGVSN